MQTKDLQPMKRAMRAALLVLLLSVVGMTKMQAQNITFADASVKAICVANWDTNGDGELSYTEATVVTSLGELFRNNSSITSFDELQYFMGLTSIGNHTFYGCSGLSSIEIPNSVTSIGVNAFRGCTGLSSIEIPNSVTYIGNNAFYSCSGLEQIIVDAGNSAYDSREDCNAIIKTSTNELMAGCKNTVIPNSVTSIGNYAFYDCSGLSSIEIPNSVISIGNYAFSYCSSLSSIEIPNSVTYIGNNAFYSCSGLEQIIVDAGNSAYDSREDCNAIIKTSTNELMAGCKNTVIPNSVTSIGNYAFYGCTGLSSIEIPNSVTSIGVDAFYGCTGLSSIEIPNSVASIGNYAFSSCSNLTSMTVLADIPPTFGNYTFYKIDKEIPVYVPCGNVDAYTTANWGGFSNFIGCCGGTVSVVANPEEGGIVTGGGMYGADETCTVTATANDGYVFALWTRNGTRSSTNTEYTFYVSGEMDLVAHFVPNGNITFADANAKSVCVDHWDTNGDGELSYVEAAAVGSLGEVFRDNSSITSFDELQYFIGLTSIGYKEFYNCTGLTSIEIPNSVNSINERSFSYCTGLTSIEIPNSVTSISSAAFSYCYGLEQIIVDAGNSTYDSREDCNAIIKSSTNELITGCKNTVVPNSVTSIGVCAFEGCSGLISIEIPNSVTSIGGWAFYGCTGLSSIEIPNSVTSIGTSAFYDCSGLTSIEIPNSVTSIGNGAFHGCSGLTSISIPHSVTSIGNTAFVACSGLEQIIVDAGNSTYDSREDCNAIIKTNTNELMAGCKNTVIPNSVTSIGDYAFDGHSGLISIEIPNSVTSIGYSAFYYCSGLSSIEIPNSVTSIGDYAFSDCTGLTSIEIPHSVTSIGNRSFSRCSGLEQINVEAGNTDYDSRSNCNAIINSSTNELITGCRNTVIPDSVTSIGGGAFSYCTGLTSLEIPNSVTSIGDMAFFGCTGLTSITVWADNPPVLGRVMGYGGSDTPPEWIFPAYASIYNVNRYIPVYVPCGSMEAYQNAGGWSEFANIQEVCSQNQTVQLAEGTNWFSTYIDISLDDLKTALVAAAEPNTTIMIKNSTQSIVYSRGHWNGTLDWDVAKKYNITVASACELTLEGMPVVLTMHPITIVGGGMATWIGFPLIESMTLTNAFAGFAQDGDIVKTQYGNAIYSRGHWNGEFSLEPGKGYLYISAEDAANRTLTFHTGAK